MTNIKELERLASAATIKAALKSALDTIKHAREADALFGWGVVNEIEPYLLIASKAIPDLIKQLEAARETIKAGEKFAINAAQIIDVVKGEWTAQNSWSDWDQSVRNELTDYLRRARTTLGETE